MCSRGLPQGQNVVVRCGDTDELIIVLGNSPRILSEANEWLDIWVFSNDSLRFSKVDNFFFTRCRNMSCITRFSCIYTGRDTSLSFIKKGRITAREISVYIKVSCKIDANEIEKTPIKYHQN